jgi:hypothetical protein
MPLGIAPQTLDRSWPLASTLLCGVRTFLPVSAVTAAGAIARPAHLSKLSMKDLAANRNRRLLYGYSTAMVTVLEETPPAETLNGMALPGARPIHPASGIRDS